MTIERLSVCFGYNPRLVRYRRHDSLRFGGGRLAGFQDFPDKKTLLRPLASLPFAHRFAPAVPLSGERLVAGGIRQTFVHRFARLLDLCQMPAPRHHAETKPLP